MENDSKAENTLRIFINGFLNFQIHYFLKRLLFDKEELILDKEGLILDMGKYILSQRLRDFLSKNQREIHELLSINQEDPPR